MRSLAQYVMKGRTQAILAVVISIGTLFFAWAGAAIVALVTLRKGSKEGSKLLAWGMFPAIFMAGIGDTSPVTTLLGVYFSAIALRTAGQWSWALVAAVTSGLLTSWVLYTFGIGYIEQIIQILEQALKPLAERSAADGAVVLAAPNAAQIAGLLGLSNAFTVIMCLLLARWWQAVLYNPGGFRTEFHRFRLSPVLTIVLLALGIAVSSLGQDYRFWAVIFALPFCFAGVALVHGLAAKKRLGSNWLLLFYIAWLFFDPLKAVLLIAVVVDSWLDLRSRVSSSD